MLAHHMGLGAYRDIGKEVMHPGLCLPPAGPMDPALTLGGRGVPFLTSSRPTTPATAALAGAGLQAKKWQAWPWSLPSRNPVFSALVVSGFRTLDVTVIQKLNSEVCFLGHCSSLKKGLAKGSTPGREVGLPLAGWGWGAGGFPSGCGLPWLFCPNPLHSRPAPLMPCMGPQVPECQQFLVPRIQI